MPSAVSSELFSVVRRSANLNCPFAAAGPQPSTSANRNAAGTVQPAVRMKTKMAKKKNLFSPVKFAAVAVVVND